MPHHTSSHAGRFSSVRHSHASAQPRPCRQPSAGRQRYVTGHSLCVRPGLTGAQRWQRWQLERHTHQPLPVVQAPLDGGEVAVPRQQVQQPGESHRCPLSCSQNAGQPGQSQRKGGVLQGMQSACTSSAAPLLQHWGIPPHSKPLARPSGCLTCCREVVGAIQGQVGRQRHSCAVHRAERKGHGCMRRSCGAHCGIKDAARHRNSHTAGRGQCGAHVAQVLPRPPGRPRPRPGCCEQHSALG